ncbi:MAG: T9SS type A sorting domain-containing protein, partial [Ignavibacteria bacterium]
SILFFSPDLTAQNFLQRFDEIPFTINNVSSLNPFNGGIDQPRFQMVNIDGDADLDLFIYDKDTSLNFYKNEGTSQNPVFKMISARYLNLQIKNWFYFIDMDADSDLDLFTGDGINKIRYFRNIGTPVNPNFILFLNPLRTNNGDTILAESISNHTLADINADGDYDLFLGSSIGEVAYYQNVGTPQNFIFQFGTSRFANILIIGKGSNCPPSPGFDNERHGANAVFFSDNDGDNDLDWFWGDLFHCSIYFLKNNGTPQNFNFSTVDTLYPPPIPLITAGFNMTRIYDIDNDGRKDIFAGVLFGSQTKNNFFYYRNIGPLNNPLFTKITENYILNLDVGANSFPAFTDIDNDSDRDLFIGSDHSTVAFYRNTGTQTSPSYTLVTDSLPILHTSFYYAPAFGDLDGDGRKDLLLGAFDGKLRYFKNTGTITNPVFSLQASQFDTIDVGQSSAPALVDIDNDGDLDLFVGNSDGKLFYYRNDGTPMVFNFVFVTNFYQSISVGNDSSPNFADMDNDNDYDLFIGNRIGLIAFYRNIGTPNNPNFVLVPNYFSFINVYSASVPAFVDIDNDTDKDIFVGNIKGGLYYYENRDVIGINLIGNEIPENFKLYQNYPNPFNPSTNIKFDIISVGTVPRTVRLIIYDILGREIASLVHEELKPGTYEVEWNGNIYASGIYFYRLTSGDFIESKKMVLNK